MSPSRAPEDGTPEHRTPRDRTPDDRNAGERPREAPSGEATGREEPSRARRRRALGAAGCAALGLLLAAAVRLPLLPHQTDDYRFYLTAWYEFIAANGHLAAMQFEFANYNLPYLYLLAAASWLFPDLSTLAGVKGVSLVFDLLLALAAALLVRQRHPGSALLPVLAGAAVLLTPPVVLNSAYWAQSDTTFTAFLALAPALLLVRRPALAATAFGLALSLKLQAVFLLPLFCWLAAKREIRWRHLLPGPLVCLLALAPAWVVGRPLYDLLLVYVEQADLYRQLSMAAPTLYLWLPPEWFPFWPLGAALAVAVLAGTGALVARSRAALTPDLLLTLATFSVLATPYLLPKMFDRYFFPAVVFSIVLAFYRPRFAPAAVAVSFAAIGSNLANRLGIEAALTGRFFSVVLFAVLVVLGRSLLQDLGYRAPLASAREWFVRAVGRVRRVGAPAALLLGCLAAVFVLGSASGRFTNPIADAALVRPLARAANLSAEHRFAAFTRRTLDAEGAVRYDLDNDLPLPANLAAAVVAGHFDEDETAGLVALRVFAAVLVGLAALLTYGGLRRLLEHRWIALGATLLAFSAFFSPAFAAPSPEGALALCAVFLSFHGMAVFVRGGGLRQLLGKSAAALALSFAALPLLLLFVLLGMAAEARRRFAGGTAPPPERRGFPEAARAFAGSRYLRIGVFAVAVAGAFFALNRANERVLAAEGARLEAVRPAPAEAGPPVAGAVRRLGHRVLPAVAGEGAGPGRTGLAGLLGGLLGVIALVGAARSPGRLGLLPPAVVGLLSALGGVEPLLRGGGAAALEPAVSLGLPLVFFALVLLAVRRSLGERPLRISVGLAAAVFLVSASGAAGVRGAFSGEKAGETAGKEAGKEAARVRRVLEVREDFREFRRLLRRRAGEPAVFLPAGLLAEGAAPPAAGQSEAATRFLDRSLGNALGGWLLAGNPVVRWEDRRGLADFVVRDEPAPGQTPLVPGTGQAFLYHRAALDGEVGPLVAAAGEPRIRGEFAVHLHENRLLYVREGCRPEDQAGQFVLHLDPVEPNDLGPYRRQYGFENLWFRFDWRALDRGERCVARVRLPDYPIRRIVTGRHPGRTGAPWIWRAEIHPTGDAAAVE